MSKLDQLSLQTGSVLGSRRHGDPHPTAAGIVYGAQRSGRERWITKFAYDKKRASQFARYQRKMEDRYNSDQAYRVAVDRKRIMLSLRTGYPRGTFSVGDYHPTEAGFFFIQTTSAGDEWGDESRLVEFRAYGRAHRRAYDIANPPTEEQRMRHAARSAKRRATKAASPELSPTEKLMVAGYYSYASRLNSIFGAGSFHVDHTTPLSKGGVHCPSNLQVVPARWNMSKGDRHCERWQAPFGNE